MYDFYDAKPRKARKEHTCDLCINKIKKGESYIATAGKWEGDFFRHKLHIHCDAWLDKYLQDTNQRECSFEEVRDWLYEKCRVCEHNDEDCTVGLEPYNCKEELDEDI
jgi:hypothetical protein